LSETDTAPVARPLTKRFKVFVLRTFGYDRVQFIFLAVSIAYDGICYDASPATAPQRLVQNSEHAEPIVSM